MQTYDKAKCYDAQGQLTRSGVMVSICDDIVIIGASTYPIDELMIDREERTISSPNGWSVQY